MPPKKDEQPRRANGPRRPAEPRTSNIQDKSNAASQPTVPQPIRAQTSTRQIPSGVNHNNAQGPSQRPALSYSDVVQNKPSLPQSSGDGSSTLPQSAARQSSSVASQNKAQRPRQQPAPKLIPPSHSAVAKNNMNPPQRFREDLPIQAQSSTRHDSNVGNQNNAPRLAQTTNPKSIPASHKNVAGNNMNPPQRSDGPSRHPSNIRTGDLSRATRPSWPAGNQAKPEKRLFPPYQGPASRETDTYKEAPKIYGGRDGVIPRPDKDVNKVENDLIKPGFVPNQQGSKFCVRPAYGSQGTSVTLWTNYLELKLPSKGLILNSYNIIVEPDANNKVPKGDRKRQLIRLLLEDDSVQAIMPEIYATDFNTSVITKDRLEFQPGETSVKFRINFRHEGAVHQPISPTPYNIRIEKAVPSNLAMEHHEPPVLQAFNVIVSHHTRQTESLARVGNKKMFPLDAPPETFGPADLGRGLIALKGFYINTIGATSRTLLNVNISHGAFYKSSYGNSERSSLVDLMWARCPNNDFGDLHQFLRGLRVCVTHLPEENKAFGKIRTVCGLAIEGDGANLDHPPRLSGTTFGGNPWQVEFYEDFATQSSSNTGSSKNLSGAASVTKPKIPSSKSTNGSYITVKDFFDKTYPDHSGRIVTSAEFRNPVVNVGTRAKPIYLPAEMCEVLPGQVSRAKLDPDQTALMINFAKRDPGANAVFIVEEGREALEYTSPLKLMSQFSVTVGDDLITVPGRILSFPKIEYKKSVAEPQQGQLQAEPKVSTVLPRMGSWNFEGLRLYQPVRFELRWQCLSFATGNPKNRTLDKILSDFQVMMTDCGIKSQPPLVWRSSTGDLQSIKTLLDRVSGREDNSDASTQKRTGSNAFAGPSMVKKASKSDLLLIILPSHATELYRTIKTIADTKLGIHTVCVVGDVKKFYGDKTAQYNANVILKINLKLDGINHKLSNDNQALGLIGDGTTMVVGIDVTHPSPGSMEGAPSIFAVVASRDRSLSQWPVRFGVQKKSCEEVISNKPRLITMFRELLEVWQAKNRKYPENIIVYRDGVSEGQYNAVIEQELAVLREACSSCHTRNPRLTLIVVAKRHHTRFYPTERDYADSTNNAKCGTVVDRGITQAQTWDFFLQSHSVIKGGTNKPSGTARPAHYVVLHDEVFEERFKSNPADKADQLQQITHNMCYLYGPATKAISICPPVYLADKACTRARLYLNDAFSPPSKDEMAKRKDKKDEKDETPEEKEQREKDENEDLQGYQNRIEVREDLKDTMFYI